MLIDHLPFKHIQLKHPNDIADVLNKLHNRLPQFDKEKESLYVIGINRRHAIVYIDWVSMGSISGTVADATSIFRMAVHKSASRIVMAHNHPSGNTEPSNADIKMTQKIKMAGRTLEIILMDHIIFTEENGYYSFANEGML